MSVTIPTGYGLASIVLVGGPGTPPYVTTIGIDMTAAADTAAAYATTVHEAYATAIMGDTSDALTLDHVDLAVGGENGSVRSFGETKVGENTAQMAPLAMSAIASKVTSGIGRSSKGRMFLPGTVDPAGVDESGAWTPTVRSGWTANMKDFFDNLVAGVPGGPITLPGAPPVLLHSGPSAPDPIIALTCAQLVGWVRGRIH